MTKGIKWISAGIIRFRMPIVVLTALITLVFGYFLKDLKINPDILSYLPKQDPVARLNAYVGEQYGGSQLAVVALESENVFSKELIARIHQLTSELQRIKGVQQVTSLTNVLDIKKVGDMLKIGRLIDTERLPKEGELAALRGYVLSKAMFRGRLVSEDGRATVILCRLREEADKAQAAQAIRNMVIQAGIDQKFYFAGLPFQLLEINQLVLQDMLRLSPLAAFLIVITLYLGFGSLRGVILPLLVAGISTVWALGVMSLLNVSFSVITNIIPVVLIAVGSAYSIHVISQFNEEAHRPDDPKLLAGRALSKIALPVILAALTTMAGFLSFILSSYLTMIRDFGIFSSLGILFALILSLTFLPTVLSPLPPAAGKKQGRPAPRARSRSGRPTWARLKSLVLKHPLLILLLSACLLFLSLLGLPRVKREVDLTSYFKADTDIRRAEQLLKDKFGGSSTLQILVQGDLQEPAVLREMKALESFLGARPELHNVHSIVELIEELNFAISDRRLIPDTKEKIANLWFLLEGEEMLFQLVDEQKTEAVIRATVQSLNAKQIDDIIRAVQGYIAAVDPEICSFQLTGAIPIFQRVDQGIWRSQIQSLIIAMLLVLLCNIILLRSLIGGLIGIIPIGFTLLMLFGIMGFGRIPLDVATVLIGSISLGIGIDYSIHFLSRFRQEVSEPKGQQESGSQQDRAAALGRVLESTGKAILINLMTVAAGFLSLVLGNLIPLKHFGLLIAITMLCSGLGTLLLLPAIIFLSPGKVCGHLGIGNYPLRTHYPGIHPLRTVVKQIPLTLKALKLKTAPIRWSRKKRMGGSP